MPTVRIIVKGLVQGVGFRYYCYRSAKVFGLKGYAKNLYNGDVEIIVQGMDGPLNEFFKRVRIGPPSSRVKSIFQEELKKEENFKTFEVY